MDEWNDEEITETKEVAHTKWSRECRGNARNGNTTTTIITITIDHDECRHHHHHPENGQQTSTPPHPGEYSPMEITSDDGGRDRKFRDGVERE